ncbi:MAG: phosphotyrosine protein phosphatase [marine bacterium B5-7]|nr:MAG: phosphotyrosine protein phosphatase [marine bacterium B5-7]
MIKVLFVCTGNICRSPTAEGVVRDLVQQASLHQQVEVDSAGTADWHVGNAPDPRSREAARRRGIILDHLVARQIQADDFERFDYVLAMDAANIQALTEMAEDSCQSKIRLFMDFDTTFGVSEIPDPYYGGDGGFDRVLDMIEAAGAGLINDLQIRINEAT